jgi:TRAP-type C4-dicarboxylate transport system permease small subunit
MRDLLQRVDTWILRIASLLFAGFLVCVVLQVFFRYVLQRPLDWSEELAVYLFIWSSLLAAAILVGKDEHFVISFFVERLCPASRRALEVAITLLCMGFALLVVVKGINWSWRMRSALSTILQVPQGTVYTIIPLSACYMLFHLLDRLMRLLFGPLTKDGRPC